MLGFYLELHSKLPYNVESVCEKAIKASHDDAFEIFTSPGGASVINCSDCPEIPSYVPEQDNNDTVYLVKIGLSSADTIIGRNMRWILRQMGRSVEELMSKNNKLKDSSSEEDQWAVKTIQE